MGKRKSRNSREKKQRVEKEEVITRLLSISKEILSSEVVHCPLADESFWQFSREKRYETAISFINRLYRDYAEEKMFFPKKKKENENLYKLTSTLYRGKFLSINHVFFDIIKIILAVYIDLERIFLQDMDTSEKIKENILIMHRTVGNLACPHWIKHGNFPYCLVNMDRQMYISGHENINTSGNIITGQVIKSPTGDGEEHLYLKIVFPWE